MDNINNINWKRNIVFFLVGKSITLFGSMLVHYAILWHITLETQSGAMMTLLAIAGALPMFFASPFGGVWADRYNKKLIINLSDAVIAAFTLVLAILFAFDMMHITLLLACTVMRALGQGVQMPAFNAMLPEIVPEEHLIRANGLNGGIQSFVMFASPMAGAAILAVAPIHILMFIDVVTAAIGISILVFLVKTPYKAKAEKSIPGAKQYFLEISEGVKCVRSKIFLKKFIVLSALFNFMISPASIMTPLHVARNYGDEVWMLFGTISVGAEQRLALLEILYFGGMMLGGLIITLWGGFKNKSRTMAFANFFLGAATIGLGLFGNFWLYILSMGVIGVSMNIFNPPMMATLQTNIEPEYMGRVFSLITMLASLVMPMGMIIWGPLGDVIDIGWLMLGTGTVLFLMSFAFLFDKDIIKAGRSKPVP